MMMMKTRVVRQMVRSRQARWKRGARPCREALSPLPLKVTRDLRHFQVRNGHDLQDFLRRGRLQPAEHVDRMHESLAHGCRPDSCCPAPFFWRVPWWGPLRPRLWLPGGRGRERGARGGARRAWDGAWGAERGWGAGGASPARPGSRQSHRSSSTAGCCTKPSEGPRCCRNSSSDRGCALPGYCTGSLATFHTFGTGSTSGAVDAAVAAGDALVEGAPAGADTRAPPGTSVVGTVASQPRATGPAARAAGAERDEPEAESEAESDGVEAARRTMPAF